MRQKKTDSSQQYMMLVVKKPNGEYLPLQLKRNATMGQVLATVCKAWNIPMEQAQLYRHNAVMPLHETAMNLHLEDQETLLLKSGMAL
mmetsp:Transcript_64208/g.206829  ORF Transcript_64208/g.206829 Transcript_64208/m.206829 type:complete len:88 (+) Transcript_64208:863-1126(+)